MKKRAFLCILLALSLCLCLVLVSCKDDPEPGPDGPVNEEPPAGQEAEKKGETHITQDEGGDVPGYEPNEDVAGDTFRIVT